MSDIVLYKKTNNKYEYRALRLVKKYDSNYIRCFIICHHVQLNRAI